jgi:hypothetical protein
MAEEVSKRTEVIHHFLRKREGLPYQPVEEYLTVLKVYALSAMDYLLGTGQQTT